MSTSSALRPVLFAGIVASAAGAAEKPLPAHESLLPGEYVEALTTVGGEKANVEAIAVDDQPFERAVRVMNRQRMTKFYDFQLCVKTDKAVRKGDILLVRFHARGAAPKNETGEAEAQVYFQKTSPNWFKNLSQRISVGSDWQRFDYPFVVSKPYDAGQTGLYFGTGFNEQVIEIGGVQLLRFGGDVKLRDLPRTPVRYRGSEPDAAWRAEAAARIEEFRKADLRVRVTNKAGKPIRDAKVTVEMTRHAFHFASIINASFIAKGGADVERYKQKVLELFNASGNENALKWPAWDGHWGKTHTQADTLRVLKWLKDSGLYVRGHVMVWPSWRHVPKSLQKLKDTPDSVRQAVREHIIDVATKTKGAVDEWDVINETRSNHDLMDLCGREVMVDWFKTARDVLPDRDLYINDYSILNGGGPGSATHETYKDTIQFLLDSGAPVTGIGFQSHIGSNLQDPAKVVRILNDFAKLELKMRITEFDIDVVDEQAQADYTRDFITAVFSHPGVVGFQMWGFWEGRHWKPNGAMYRRNWEAKPNAHAYKDLVFKQWWTRETRTSDAAGKCDVRGFLGDYKVTVTSDTGSATVDASLTKDGTSLIIALD